MEVKYAGVKIQYILDCAKGDVDGWVRNGLFERDFRCGCKDCFFCKFSDFRKREYIDKVESEARRGILYSVCHNEKNKLSEQRRKMEQ